MTKIKVVIFLFLTVYLHFCWSNDC